MLYEGGHYFFCHALFPSKQTTTRLQRSSVGRTFRAFYHFQLESSIVIISLGASSSTFSISAQKHGRVRRATKTMFASALTNLRGWGKLRVYTIRRLVLFFLAGQIARVLFESEYYSTCGYYSRKYSSCYCVLVTLCTHAQPKEHVFKIKQSWVKSSNFVFFIKQLHHEGLVGMLRR